MEWYLPITILPGVGMLILSTVNQMMSLSSEIGNYVSKPCDEFEHRIADRKIKQLGLITRASALLYLSAGAYVLSGIFGGILMEDSSNQLPNYILYIGTFFVFGALTLLIIYAFRAVSIRRVQFQNSQHRMIQEQE